MMTPQTVQQLLQVFRAFRDNHKSGMLLRRAYQEGVRAVADNCSITYQTVGDGCRRRLGLNDIGELHELLASWVKGDPRGLVRQLRAHSDPSAHSDIEQFFSGGDSTPVEIKEASPTSPAPEETEVFQFRVPAREARMLRALAELEGVSASELIGKTISAAVRDRMAAVARGIIKDAEAHA